MPNNTVDQTIQLANSEPLATPVASGKIEQVGPYIVEREIGRGAMGTVYLAKHENLGRSVAVKILPPELAGNTDRLKRFQREMVAIGCLEHENIVLATDAGHADGFFYIAMQFIDGMDLDQILEKHNRLEVATACEIIRQAANGLQHIHEHKLVHRDIKASNIAITSDGTAKVLDLGIARLRRDETDESSLTSDQATLGTPDYMAPEQIRGARDVDIRADIYSLGCTLYKLISGHAPFDGPDYETGAAKMVAHVSDDPRPLNELCPELDSNLSELVRRMMSKSPDDRPATPSLVADELAEWSDATGLRQLASGGASPQSPIDTPTSRPDSVGSRKHTKPKLAKSTKGFVTKSRLATFTVLVSAMIAAAMLAPKLKGSADEQSNTTSAILQSTESIAANTQNIADSNESIANNTQQMVESLDALRQQFQSLNSSAAIDKPTTPADLYHNATIYAQKGNNLAARKSFLNYFQRDLGVVDPHLRFIGFLKLQEGLAGAREVYSSLPGNQSAVPRQFATAMLADPAERRAAMQSVVQMFPKFAPAYFELSKTFSGQSGQSFADKKTELELLTAFIDLHEQGHLVRYYLDQNQALQSIESAQRRLDQLSANNSTLKNPVSFTVAPLDGNNCLAVISVAEVCTEILYRLGESGDYQSTGVNEFGPVNHQTGRKMPTPTVEFETQIPLTIHVKYVDKNGKEQGPFSHAFDPNQSRLDLAIHALKSRPNGWVRLHKDGSLYFDLLGHWRGLSEVRYGVGEETPNLSREIPISDTDLDENSVKYGGISVPPTTPYISVQVKFTDGTQSDVVKIKRLNR